MRTLTVLCLLFVASACGHFMTKDVKYADKEFLTKQKFFFEILHHVYQRDFHNDYFTVAENYHIKDHYADFTKEHVAEEFWMMYEHGMLPFEEIFSITVHSHSEEVHKLFEMFYYAKDWDTFYKMVTWARFHIHPDMFVYALTAAVLHRKDMAGFVLPAVYEINPFYFYSSDMIQKAESYKMKGFHDVKKVDDVYTVYVNSNYTKWFEQLSDNHQMSYFTDDVGLNSYYYYFHMDYPYWMGGDEFHLNKDRRGEFYLYQYQQFLARYYLERLSNHMDKVEDFSFEDSFGEGYYPNLRYFNGLSFPTRDYYFTPSYDTHLVEAVEAFERRVWDAIDQGFFYDVDGKKYDLHDAHSIEYLGNLMQNNGDNVHDRFFGFWEMYAKSILSPTIDFNDKFLVIPGVLEHFETAMREPLFYQFYKRFLNPYWQFKNHLDHYKYKDLNFENVKIDSVHVDKLITYFDWFEADITNVVDTDHIDYTEKKHKRDVAHWEEEDFVIFGRTMRLNHVPFSVDMTVHSDKAQQAIVKYFIGPKYDVHGNVYNYEDNRENWYELDHYVVDLVAGENVIKRKSTDFSWFVNDRTTYFQLYKEVLMGLAGEHKFPLDMSEAHCGFPRRLMLPRGTKGGMHFQMAFFVYPYHVPKVEQFTGYDKTVSCGVGSGARFIDDTPYGFPFDRQFEDFEYHMPKNMYFYDTVIYFKTENEINAVHH